MKWNGSGYSAVGANAAGTNGYFPVDDLHQRADDLGIAPVRGRLVAERRRPADRRRRRVLRRQQLACRSARTAHGSGPWVGDTQALAVFGGQLYAGGALHGAGGDKKANFAASRSLRLPDAEIGSSPGGYVGNDVYNRRRSARRRRSQIARGAAQYFPVLIQNEGLLPASFKVKGTGAATGYTVTYIDYATARTSRPP